jgi:threonine aldolase
LCGNKEFIQKARRMRKQLGGGMRQAGILAAAGIVALKEMTDRLKEDHARARSLAQGLAVIPGISINQGAPASNMIFIMLDHSFLLSDQDLVEQLKGKGILIGKVGPRQFRLVTHYWITDEAVEKTLKSFNEVVIH